MDRWLSPMRNDEGGQSSLSFQDSAATLCIRQPSFQEVQSVVGKEVCPLKGTAAGGGLPLVRVLGTNVIAPLLTVFTLENTAALVVERSSPRGDSTFGSEPILPNSLLKAKQVRGGSSAILGNPPTGRVASQQRGRLLLDTGMPPGTRLREEGLETLPGDSRRVERERALSLRSPPRRALDSGRPERPTI
ncbi:unnamed protein product [Sphagnum tenellum]